jgi:regulator of nonsense transcripts 2
LGPSEEAEAEFAKELAKMVTDSSTESRKVDKKTALAMWDSAVLPPGTRKKRADESTDEGSVHGQNGLDAKSNVMNFTVVSKRGNKQNVRRLGVPSQRLPTTATDSSNSRSSRICNSRSHSLRSVAR